MAAHRLIYPTEMEQRRSRSILRTAQVHIWTRPRCQGGCKLKNTLRDRCSHISGLLVKTFYGLRALMKSALPLLITTAASRALSLIRVKGSRSDLSCHQLDATSHRAAGLLHVLIQYHSHQKFWHHSFCDSAVLQTDRCH